MIFSCFGCPWYSDTSHASSTFGLTFAKTCPEVYVTGAPVAGDLSSLWADVAAEIDGTSVVDWLAPAGWASKEAWVDFLGLF